MQLGLLWLLFFFGCQNWVPWPPKPRKAYKVCWIWICVNCVKIKFWTLLGWFLHFLGKVKLGMGLRLLDSKNGFSMIENLGKHIEFLKIELLCQWEKLLLNYASIMKLWFSRLKVHAKYFNTSIMDVINKKKNCGLYGSITKRIRDSLESLNIYDDCLWAYGSGSDNFGGMSHQVWWLECRMLWFYEHDMDRNLLSWLMFIYRLLVMIHWYII